MDSFTQPIRDGLFIFVVIAIGWNLRQSAKGVPLIGSRVLPLKFMGFALGAWLIAGLFTFANVFGELNALLQYTYAPTAIRQFFAWGFFAMAMLGAYALCGATSVRQHGGLGL